MIALKRCDCTHAVQDKWYGKHMRVCNATTKNTFRCTVCRKERQT